MSEHRCPSLYAKADGVIVQCDRWLGHETAPNAIEATDHTYYGLRWTDSEAYTPPPPDLRVTVDELDYVLAPCSHDGSLCSGCRAKMADVRRRIREHGIKLDDAGEVVGVPDLGPGGEASPDA